MCFSRICKLHWCILYHLFVITVHHVSQRPFNVFSVMVVQMGLSMFPPYINYLALRREPFGAFGVSMFPIYSPYIPHIFPIYSLWTMGSRPYGAFPREFPKQLRPRPKPWLEKQWSIWAMVWRICFAAESPRHVEVDDVYIWYVWCIYGIYGLYLWIIFGNI